ncbi:EexN family lipoprotein [Pseudomonas aeruginosa]|nr:EexN family lipoprotein [Pseudomonas aeruginosa]HBP5136769.1 EexN family lipoprotein [Pseudomonas aeruginosa]
MNKIVLILLAAMLTACDKSEPTETVEALAANPERLKELRQQCKTDRAKLGDELCNRVAEATNRRFFGDGKAPYTPPKEQPKF